MIVVPNLRTPSLEDPSLAIFARTISAQSEPVRIKMAGKLKPKGHCYWNVDKVVQDSGGDAVLGWLFFIWPGRCFSAMHHSVWKEPKSGRLIDITEKYSSDPIKTHSIFMLDNSIKVPLDRQTLIENINFPLCDWPEVREYFEAYHAKSLCERIISDLQWRAGYRCESSIAAAAGRPPSPIRLLPPSGEWIRRWDAAKVDFEAAMTRLGTAINAIKARESTAT